MQITAGSRSTRALFMRLALLVVIPSALDAQTTAAELASNKGFETIKAILQTSCSACHDWTGTYDAVVGNNQIVPGSPEKSLIYQKVSDDTMPASGDKLTAAQKTFIRSWILAGAPSTDQQIPMPAEQASGGASTAASTTVAPAASHGFLFFPSKVAFHEATGFASTAILFGAGILGVIHLVDMMNTGHALRDQIGFQEGGPESVRIPLVQQAWQSDSTLGWVHVGFVAGGEALYLGDAITGLSMLTRHQPGKITKSDIHRWAFFTHVTLMTAQIVLGFFTTDALSRGAHDTVLALGAAHAAIGLAIPVVMLGAGLENIFLKE